MIMEGNRFGWSFVCRSRTPGDGPTSRPVWSHVLSRPLGSISSYWVGPNIRKEKEIRRKEDGGISEKMVLVHLLTQEIGTSEYKTFFLFKFFLRLLFLTLSLSSLNLLQSEDTDSKVRLEFDV